MIQKDLLRGVAAQISENYEKAEVPMYSDHLHLPNRDTVIQIIKNLQKVIFPAYFGGAAISRVTAETYVEFLLGEIFTDLREQVSLALSNRISDPTELEAKTDAVVTDFFTALPKIQELLMQDVHANNDKGLPALDGLDLEVFAGEIVGIAGVAGNGQKELTEAITGLRKKTGGAVSLCGTDITRKSAYDIENMGVAFVPEDRHGMGLVPGLSAVDNIMLRDFNTEASSRRGIVLADKVAKRTEELIQRYEIKCAGIHRPVRLMSGGNMQKLLLAREISGSPKLLITSYPVRGLDIGATNAVHQILEEQRQNGVAVLLISEDLEELFQLSDRIAVLHKGRITGVVERKDFNYDTVGHLMVGAAQEEGCAQNV